MNVSDIEGAVVETYGTQKHIRGRDNLDISDLENARPNYLKQNRVTNIPDHLFYTRDVNKQRHLKFNTKRKVDPINPVYEMQTPSRRHIMKVGKIEGTSPTL